ncbi:hypothetical protein [Sphingomonas sp. LaA6.9]|uniref:hypothetical protein n=1 Tax=Sphingomonas sp. LaA6.9 TaxID=2919914 RepID=UPI001F4F642A|nr:hypothetical protein [Sphingomonas sp. LaA6.9]MCJ8156845.1 hypothetical protein [Sphingomonas sp. LaA6.9]
MASVPMPEFGTWQKRISNNAAGALLLFTLLHVTCFTALAGYSRSSLVSYLGITILVGLVIPALGRVEGRWHGEALRGLTEADLNARFRTERVRLWGAAIALPFVWSGLFLGALLAFGQFAG